MGFGLMENNEKALIIDSRPKALQGHGRKNKENFLTNN